MSLYQLRVLELNDVNNIRAEIASIGADSSWLNERTDFESLHAIRLDNISTKLARFLYQEMVFEGGNVILPTRMDDRSSNSVNVIIIGTQTQFGHLAVRLRTQRIDELDILAEELERELEL